MYIYIYTYISLHVCEHTNLPENIDVANPPFVNLGPMEAMLFQIISCMCALLIYVLRWKVDHGGTPIAGWSALPNPTKMDDLGVPSVEESSISTVCT